ncbi:MAG: thymidylate synthase [Nanoarchaeota archaeon]
MEQYLEHSKIILSSNSSGYKPNRTGVDTISRFGYQAEYDLSEGFPLMTTKKIPFKSIARELLWFMAGESNIQSLVKDGVHIWDRNAFQYYLQRTGQTGKYELYSGDWHKALGEFSDKIKNDDSFAEEHGTLGEVYGVQWRNWKTPDGKIDQLERVIEQLQKSPNSRRIIMTAWNPAEVDKMALPPCHSFVQFNTLDGKLDCAMYQRSCDMFLGVPFNVASYALLTHILANEAGLKAGRFIHSLGDAHFYCGRGERGKFYQTEFSNLRNKIKCANEPEDYLELAKNIVGRAPAERLGEEGLDHVTGILEQLARGPRKLPKLILPSKSYRELKFDEIKVEDYNPLPSIKRAMAA